jgi:Reverse transcriptase (RNA-dependent DNA polymerase)
VQVIHGAQTDKARCNANKALKLAIWSAKQEWANNFLKNASTEKLWTAAHWWHGHYLCAVPALSTEAGLSNDPTSMASALSGRFFQLQPPIPATDKDNLPNLPQRSFAPITESEIGVALADTSNSSAPGPTGHGYKLVKWAWEGAPIWFVLLFNLCLLAGHHPRAWKSASIVVIPKLNKTDYSLPKSYWPVALLECLSKLLEKVMAKHILHEIGEHGLVPTSQFGACPHSLTIHTGLALTHDIAVIHAQGGCCASLQFNVQGFFNSINHTWLIQTLH